MNEYTDDCGDQFDSTTDDTIEENKEADQSANQNIKSEHRNGPANAVTTGNEPDHHFLNSERDADQQGQQSKVALPISQIDWLTEKCNGRCHGGRDENMLQCSPERASIGLTHVVLTFWWVEDFGIVGAAMATCVAYVVGNIFIINWYYYKKIGLDIPVFWKNILKMSPVMIIMGTVWWFLLEQIQVNNWLIFFALAVAYTLMYLPLAYKFMMNQYERNLVIVPVKKVLRKIHLMK